MENLKEFLGAADAFIWGPVTLVFLMGTGLYLTLGLRGRSFSRIVYGLAALWRGRAAEPGAQGQATPFGALSIALAATIGTGNIAGVATAIALGGPGAVFWMWLTAWVGMAMNFAETALAVTYREVDGRGEWVGGPMYYIKNGLGRRWRWLATLFAFFGVVSSFGGGNALQASTLADAAAVYLGMPAWATACLLAALTLLVMAGGTARLARVVGILVPVMVVGFVGGGLAVIALNVEKLPGAIGLILSDAFTGTAAAGGFAGSTVMAAVHFGVARGIFSNEAGLGTIPMAHAIAQTRHPVRQAAIGMLGPFIDTLIVCTTTGLVIVMTGVWQAGITGAPLAGRAFATGLPGAGPAVVGFGLILFTYTTLLGWSFYGERLAGYLWGPRAVLPYRTLFLAMIFVGVLAKERLDLLWLVSTGLNGLMAFPNLIALLLLSPVVFRMTIDYFALARNGQSDIPWPDPQGDIAAPPEKPRPAALLRPE